MSLPHNEPGKLPSYQLPCRHFKSRLDVLYKHQRARQLITSKLWPDFLFFYFYCWASRMPTGRTSSSRSASMTWLLNVSMTQKHGSSHSKSLLWSLKIVWRHISVAWRNWRFSKTTCMPLNVSLLFMGEYHATHVIFRTRCIRSISCPWNARTFCSLRRIISRMPKSQRSEVRHQLLLPHSDTRKERVLCGYWLLHFRSIRPPVENRSLPPVFLQSSGHDQHLQSNVSIPVHSLQCFLFQVWGHQELWLLGIHVNSSLCLRSHFSYFQNLPDSDGVYRHSVLSRGLHQRHSLRDKKQQRKERGTQDPLVFFSLDQCRVVAERQGTETRIHQVARLHPSLLHVLGGHWTLLPLFRPFWHPVPSSPVPETLLEPSYSQRLRVRRHLLRPLWNCRRIPLLQNKTLQEDGHEPYHVDPVLRPQISPTDSSSHAVHRILHSLRWVHPGTILRFPIE